MRHAAHGVGIIAAVRFPRCRRRALLRPRSARMELEEQLPRQLSRAAQVSSRIIVVYGKKCFKDLNHPARETDALIQETVENAVRLNASNCVDMLVSLEEREKMAGSEKIYWLTPGWLKHWDFIFKDWDLGKANEMFPAYDRAVVLDALGYFDRLMAESPEQILKISDWMRLPIESAPISLERLKCLIAEARGDGQVQE